MCPARCCYGQGFGSSHSSTVETRSVCNDSNFTMYCLGFDGYLRTHKVTLISLSCIVVVVIAPLRIS